MERFQTFFTCLQLLINAVERSDVKGEYKEIQAFIKFRLTHYTMLC